MGTVQLIRCADVFAAPEAGTLLEEYAAECSIPAIGKINPQPSLYEALERSGALVCFGAYRYDKLIGFATVLITVLPHYGKAVAMLESIFVGAAHRKGGAGNSLLRAVESYAAERGCAAVLYSAPAGGRLEMLLMLSKSRKRTNAVFCKSL